MKKTVQLDPRFCGPPDSGNGGMAAGLVASALPGAARVTLCAPPPLGVAMQLEGDDNEVSLTCGEHLIATGQAHALDRALLTPPDGARVGFDDALALQPGYIGFAEHNFPGCFVCGPQREPGDGLRVFAAPTADRVVAAWQPDASLADGNGRVQPRFVHAALDCPSYFAFGSTDLVALLGRMHSEVFETPAVGERLVIEAWPVERDGRKHRSAAILSREDGTLLAGAHNTWIEINGAIPKPPVPSAG